MRAAVGPPPRLGLLQRAAQPHRHQRVLERSPLGPVHVDVPSRDARNAKAAGELLQPAVASPVVPPERPLKLDPEAIRPERGQQPLTQRRCPLGLAALPAPRQRPLTRAARQAHEPLTSLLQRFEPQDGGEGVAIRGGPSVPVRLRDEPAEIAIAACILHQESQVKWSADSIRHGHLRAGDGADALRAARLRELHRSPDPIVVRESDRPVPELRSRQRQLVGQRCPVSEREGGMHVEFYVLT